MTRFEARQLMRLWVQDIGGRIGDTDYNAVLHDAYVAYKRAHNRWQSIYSAIWSMLAGNTNQVTQNVFSRHITKILSVHRNTTSTGEHGPELEMIGFEEVVRMQNADATQAAPRFCNVMRVDDGGVNDNTSPSELRLVVWPIPNTTYWFSVRAYLMGDRLDADGQVLEVEDDETYLVVRDAARLVARLLGRPEELVQGIDAHMAERIAQGRTNALRAARVQPAGIG